MAKRERQQAKWERKMAPQIAEAEAAMMAAVMHPDRTEATTKAAMIQFHVDIRRLVNEYMQLDDDSEEMGRLLTESLLKSEPKKDE